MKNLCAKLNRTKKLDSDVLETQLNRCLNTFDIALLGIGHMIGAGIYVLTGDVAKNVAGPGIVLSFIIAGKTSLLAALCYAEFGARVPKAGSAYVYTYVTIGEFWAFVIGWNIVLEHMIGSASVARAWSGYVDSLFGGVIQNGTLTYVGSIHVDFFGNYPDFVAFAVCIVLGCLLAFGVKGSTYFNSVFTIVNIMVVGFVVCFGLYWADIDNWTEYGGFLPFGTKGVLAGAATCFYAFVGFDSIATSGEEAKNPTRSIPIATAVAMAVVTVAYIGVSSALTLMIPYVDIKPDSALPDAFAHNGADWAKYVVALGALCGMTTTLFGGLFALPRCIYAMAVDGLFFQVFGRVHKQTQTPLINLIICSVLTGIIALLFDIRKLVEFMSIGTLMAYTIVSASVIILRYQPSYKYRVGFDGLDGLSKHGSQENLAIPDCAGKLKPKWTFLESIVDCDAGTVVTATVLLMTMFMAAFWGVINVAAEEVWQATWWAVLLVIFFLGCSVCCFVVICFHQQSSVALHFKVPGVPAVPALSIFLNVALMCHLHWLTWVRFLIWMTIGMLIYFMYGIHHSKERSSQQMYSPLTSSNEAHKSAWGTMKETIHCPQFTSNNQADDKLPIVEEDSEQ